MNDYTIDYTPTGARGVWVWRHYKIEPAQRRRELWRATVAIMLIYLLLGVGAGAFALWFGDNDQADPLGTPVAGLGSAL